MLKGIALLILSIVLGTIALLNTSMAQSEAIEPQWVTCSAWSGWADLGPSFCSSSVLCIHCWPWLEGRFQDQIRRRTCQYGATTWEELQSRTIRTGCCGVCIPLPSSYANTDLSDPVFTFAEAFNDTTCY